MPLSAGQLVVAGFFYAAQSMGAVSLMTCFRHCLVRFTRSNGIEVRKLTLSGNLLYNI
ncbi:hypothetical protein [Erwinia psidii]|uniref:hypothetical protein n=1 Tax=Erwinia psidii TaxID=69224 RepID=UPI00226B7771|nr:hypothetical protein [Erwinia psidii]